MPCYNKFIVAVCVCVWAVSCSVSVHAQRLVPYYEVDDFYFLSPIEFVDNKTGQEFRLRGLTNPVDDEAALQALNAEMKGETLSCTAYDKGGDKAVVWCNYGIEPQKILTEVILQKHLAVENCEETGGQFGGCE